MTQASHSDNIKKVLRIALVGIRPADQVMLKGYLRILMRLEVDLEWVSANHEAVDLFMINNEFRQVDSVQRLLLAKPQSGVLYIGRADNEEGSLVGNVLNLPVKNLEPLKQWLYTNLKFLAGQMPAKIAQNAQESNQRVAVQPQNTNKTSTIDEIIASRQNNVQSNQNPAPQAVSQPVANQPVAPAQIDKNIALAMAQILVQLVKREDTLFSLNDKNGTLLAYIHPKQQRIWQIKPINQAEEWKLNTVSQNALNPNESEDLAQFFWQFGLKNAKYFQPLVNITTQYHLASWVKPENNNQRHNALKIQCVLEARPVTLGEIVQLSGVDAKIAMVMVISLILSGVMDKKIYQNLEKTVASYKQNTPEPVITAPTHVASLPTNHATTSLQQEIKAEEPKVQQEESSGMKGFLSRLRSKLGI